LQVLRFEGTLLQWVQERFVRFAGWSSAECLPMRIAPVRKMPPVHEQVPIVLKAPKDEKVQVKN
jgi:hypothetical protein